MNIELDESVKNAVDFIIESKNYNAPPEVNITNGSDVGDGYTSKTYAISIGDKSGESTNLFVKCLPSTITGEYKEASQLVFRTEFKFYNEIYPAFEIFQGARNIKKPFNNVPKFYKTNVEDCEAPPIVMEDVRSLGYTLRDRLQPVDDEHLTLPIKTFAKYHAISYAMKDQEPELFQKLSVDLIDVFTENIRKFGFVNIVINIINQFLESLNPDSDKKLLDHCKNLPNILVKFIANVPQLLDEYAIIGQGDSWTSNMMFLYDDKSGLPLDVKLIDWQHTRLMSPLIDFSYFFYTLATKKFLVNTKVYLNLYYETLSQSIKEFGTDPEKAYPYEVFMKHWRKFAPFGLFMAFYIVKVQLFQKEEVPDIMHSEGNAWQNSFLRVQKNHGTFLNRMRDIIEHFVDNNLI